MNPVRNNAAKIFLVLAAIGGIAALVCAEKFRHKPIAPAVVRAVARHDLVMHDGRWFKPPETNPFTGVMEDTFANGSLMARCGISNGLANGLSETWYTNGQMQMREGFSNGLSQGLREKWYPGGRKMSEATLAAGKITGTFLSWHENGQLSERMPMPDGIAWAWYPSGFAKVEATMRDGKVLDRKTWKDGEYKTTK